jgi:hypothetical protein
MGRMTFRLLYVYVCFPYTLKLVTYSFVPDTYTCIEIVQSYLNWTCIGSVVCLSVALLCLWWHCGSSGKSREKIGYLSTVAFRYIFVHLNLYSHGTVTLLVPLLSVMTVLTESWLIPVSCVVSYNCTCSCCKQFVVDCQQEFYYAFDTTEPVSKCIPHNTRGHRISLWGFLTVRVQVTIHCDSLHGRAVSYELPILKIFFDLRLSVIYWGTL